MGDIKNIKNNSNKGFSLVEILVAVIILGIIVAPMLRSFVLSSQMNQMSRRTMNAVKIAEDLMESIKSMQAEEVDLEFVSENCTLIDRNMMSGSVSASFARLLVDDSGDMADQPVSVSFDRLDKRAYVIRNIYPMTERSESYDALIMMDPTTYVESPSGVSVSNNAGYFNSAKLFSIKPEEGTQMAVYSQDFATFAKVVNSITGEIGAGWSIDESTIKRNIDITIEKSGTSGSVVTLLQTFTMDGPDGTVVKRIPSTGIPQVLYDASKKEGNKDMNELYLFYYPLYKGINFSGEDTITIDNKTSDMSYKPVINLVKQTVDDGDDKKDFSAIYGIETYSDDYVFKDRLTDLENLYKTKLKLVVPVADSVELRGNLNINIGSNDVSNTFAVDMMGTTTTRNRYYDVDIRIYKSGDLADDYSGYDNNVLYQIFGSSVE